MGLKRANINQLIFDYIKQELIFAAIIQIWLAVFLITWWNISTYLSLLERILTKKLFTLVKTLFTNRSLKLVFNQICLYYDGSSGDLYADILYQFRFYNRRIQGRRRNISRKKWWQMVVLRLSSRIAIEKIKSNFSQTQRIAYNFWSCQIFDFSKFDPSIIIWRLCWWW